jgi:hypothetical protein
MRTTSAAHCNGHGGDGASRRMRGLCCAAELRILSQARYILTYPPPCLQHRLEHTPSPTTRRCADLRPRHSRVEGGHGQRRRLWRALERRPREEAAVRRLGAATTTTTSSSCSTTSRATTTTTTTTGTSPRLRHRRLRGTGARTHKRRGTTLVRHIRLGHHLTQRTLDTSSAATTAANVVLLLLLAPR